MNKEKPFGHENIKLKGWNGPPSGRKRIRTHMICVICKKKFDPLCGWGPCKLANQYEQEKK